MITKFCGEKHLRTRIYCLFLGFAMFAGNVNAQTTVFFEDFGNAPAGLCDQGTLANGFPNSLGLWTVTQLGLNDTAANVWYISATEPGLGEGDCAAPGCHVNNTFRNRTLHIGNATNSPNSILCPTGDCGAIYDPGIIPFAVRTDVRAESPSFPIQGNIQYQLSFLYLEKGDDPGVLDNGTVEFYDGSFWIPAISDPPRTINSCGTTYKWEKLVINLPIATTNTNVKVGFRWVNNDDANIPSVSFAIDSILVYELIPPTADFTVSDTNVCVGDSISFFDTSTGQNLTYAWTFSGAATPTSSAQHPANIYYPNPGTYPVYLTVTNAGGSSTDSALIVVNPCSPPVANFYASDSVFCERSCITFSDASTNGATGWNWYFPGGLPSTSSSPSPPPVCYSSPGTYSVTLIAFNQFGSDTIIKTGYLLADTCPLPIADFSSLPVQTCPQHCVSFSENSQYGPITSWRWSFPGATPDTSSLPSPTVCYDEEGFYDVQLIVTNQYGSDTIIKYSEVHAQFLPGAYASPDTEMYFGEVYQMFAGGGAFYQWSPVTGLIDTVAGVPNPNVIPNPLASPTNTTTYTVAISDSSGCVAYRQVTVTILHNNDLFVPNAFSPNGDGANDVLYIRGNNIYGLRLSIFDRWGEKIFETTDPLYGWDGTYKGKELGPGVFTYVATVNYSDKESVTQTGTVTLVR